MDIKQFMKRKGIPDSRSVENISDKRLRIEVQQAQTNGLERLKSFVNVHLHCIISNLKRISKISTLPPMEIFLRTPMVVLILIYLLGHKAWCCLVQFFQITQKREMPNLSVSLIYTLTKLSTILTPGEQPKNMKNQ